MRFLITVQQLCRPVGIRDSVVVQERHNVSAGSRDASVPRSRQTRWSGAGEHTHCRHGSSNPVVQGVVVVNDDDDLQNRQ